MKKIRKVESMVKTFFFASIFNIQWHESCVLKFQVINTDCNIKEMYKKFEAHREEILVSNKENWCAIDLSVEHWQYLMDLSM